MKKFWLLVFIFCSCQPPGFKEPISGPTPLSGQVKDTYNSFDRIGKIGLVVKDTSSLDTDFEEPIYNALTQAGADVVKIDTTTMDDSLYNDSALNWSSLAVVIIPFDTDSAAVDTSVNNGIGRVPVLVMEPYYWDSFFDGDSNDGTGVNDSIRIENTTLGDAFINNLWSQDSVVVQTVDTTYYTFQFDGDYPNGVKVARAIDGLTTSGLVAVNSTRSDIERIQWGLPFATYFNNNQFAGWTLFNRCIAKLATTDSDSIFTIGMQVEYTDSATAENSSFERRIKNHLELNAHTVYLVEDDSLANTTSYQGGSTDWSDFDGFIFGFGQNGAATRTGNVVANVTSILVLGSNASIDDGVPDSLGLATGDVLDDMDQDTVVVLTFHDLVASFSRFDTLKTMASNPTNAPKIAVDVSSGLVREDTSSNYFTVVAHDTSRYAYNSLLNNVSLAASIEPDSNAWKLHNRALGWIFNTKPFQATDFALTSLNTDSVDADWTDNDTGEDGYSLFVYEPDSAYYSHLSASVVSDTILPIWPPNSRVIADVAVINGTDTVFSVGGRDTVYTDAAVPPKMFQQAMTDTSMRFFVNGYLLDERFDDEDYTADPVWTVNTGTAGIDTVYKYLRGNSGSARINTPFADAEYDTTCDSEWSVDIQFSDSVALSSSAHFFRYFFMTQSDSAFDTLSFVLTGNISNSDSIIVRLDKWQTFSSITNLVSETSIGNKQQFFRWHNYKIRRECSISPQDTSITYTVFADGDSLGSADLDTLIFVSNIELQVGNGVRADNIQVRQLRPSANSSVTTYAVQDSVSGLYVDDNGDSLRATEHWRTFEQWGSNVGDSVGTGITGLKADSLYQFRSKARSGNN